MQVWNVESGALRSTLLAPGVAEQPAHARATEALAFLQGHPSLRHICLAVGYDQVVRFWDIKHCTLLLQHFAGANSA